MSMKIMNLYIEAGSPENLTECCEIAEWAADEIQRLRDAIKTEASYCQSFAEKYSGTNRGLRHKERADRLMSYLDNAK